MCGIPRTSSSSDSYGVPHTPSSLLGLGIRIGKPSSSAARPPRQPVLLGGRLPRPRGPILLGLGIGRSLLGDPSSSALGGRPTRRLVLLGLEHIQSPVNPWRLVLLG